MRRQRYGWRADLPDARDFKFAVTAPLVESDLRAGFPTPPYNQGQLGSCVFNSGAALVQFDQRKQNSTVWMPSRLEWYYQTRVVEGTVDSDAGATIRDALKVLVHQGVCPESDWPYTISKFKTKPPAKSIADAKPHAGDQYLAVAQTAGSMGGCLHQGYPFWAGISVYESFENDAVAKTGMVPMPNLSSEQALGGHAIVVCGFHAGRWVCRNSWGVGWGDKGYFYLPEAYLLDPGLSSDFWTLRKVN